MNTPDHEGLQPVHDDLPEVLPHSEKEVSYGGPYVPPLPGVDESGPRRRVCGFDGRNFWIVVILLAIIIIGSAIGGGVGGAVANNNHESASYDHPAIFRR